MSVTLHDMLNTMQPSAIHKKATSKQRNSMRVDEDAAQVWDSHGYVRYDAADAGEAVMGHVVENARLQAACLAAMQGVPGGAAADVRWPVSVKALQLPPYSSAKGSGSGRGPPRRYHTTLPLRTSLAF